MTNITMVDFLKAHPSGGINQSVENPGFTKVLKAFDNPTTLNKSTFAESTFSDWAGSVLRIKDYYQSEVPALDPKSEYKLEVQTAAIQAAKVAANQKYADTVGRMKERVAQEKQALRTSIVEKKYPLYSARQKSQLGNITTVSNLPDMQARAIGAQEMTMAASIPLKHISRRLLENYAAQGRIDLTSALIERAALNMNELKLENYQEVYSYAHEFYDKIGITEDRQVLKKIEAIEKFVIEPAATSNEGKIAYSEPAFAAEIAKDNLLEH